jgi:hypothetical protein
VQIRDSARASLVARLKARQRERWPQLEEIRVRFRTPFAYVNAVVEGDEVMPLCRLRYTGSAEAWRFAPYLASKDGYEPSVLPNGAVSGPPEHALDTACGLYLGDMSAWTDLFTLRRSPPTH